MLQFAALKENVNAMTAKQEQMMRLQEVRQKQHQLEIHESKLQMLNASQNAVDFMSNVSGGGAMVNPHELEQHFLFVGPIGSNKW